MKHRYKCNIRKQINFPEQNLFVDSKNQSNSKEKVGNPEN
jgi:hypothetical protein